MTQPRRLDLFTRGSYDKGRPLATQALWHGISHLVFQAWWAPGRLRVFVLRAFGAQIGSGVVIRARVRVHWPWKLEVGDHSWIGEGVWLLNLEPIKVGAHVCLSQEAALITGSHDWRDPQFRYDNKPITVGDGAWVCARALILRGVRVGESVVIPAGAVVRTDPLPPRRAEDAWPR